MLAKAREIEEARRLEEEAKRKAEEEARRKVNYFLLFPVPWCILISKMELYLPEKIAQFDSKVSDMLHYFVLFGIREANYLNENTITLRAQCWREQCLDDQLCIFPSQECI